MIIVPHDANSYQCLSTDIVYATASGSRVVGLSEIGSIVYLTDTNVNLIVLEDLSLVPLIINIA